MKDKELEAKINRFSCLFSTAQGQIVLGEMLIDLGFFEPMKSEKDMHLANYARHLLMCCGGWSPVLRKK